MESSLKQATFLQRFFAYIIDIFIVAILVSIISYPFSNNSDLEKKKIHNFF